MFVSVCCDFSNDDHKKTAEDLLLQYGFKQIMSGVFECVTMAPKTLSRLKRDMDRITDYYDKIRFYQFPHEDNNFVVSSLMHKKWRKTIMME